MSRGTTLIVSLCPISGTAGSPTEAVQTSSSGAIPPRAGYWAPTIPSSLGSANRVRFPFVAHSFDRHSSKWTVSCQIAPFRRLLSQSAHGGKSPIFRQSLRKELTIFWKFWYCTGIQVSKKERSLDDEVNWNRTPSGRAGSGCAAD